MANGQEEPGILEGLENKLAASSDDYRATLPEDQRTAYDIKVGIAKGTYGFTKSLISGLIDLSTFAVKLFQQDQEAWKKVGFAAWDVTKFVGKCFYYTYIAKPEEKQQFDKEIGDKITAMYHVVKNKVVKDWEEAKAQGKEAELISKWTTRGVLEVASLFVGIGEAKAAAEVPKLSEAAKVLEGAEVACDAEKGADAAKAVQAAAEADKAAASARIPIKPEMSPYGDVTAEELAKLQKIAKKTGKPVDVVGSAAKGTRRNVGQDLPLGKGEGTRSDLDIRINGQHDADTGGRLSDAIYEEFPKGKDVDRILTGDPYPNQPRITVNPDGTVTTHNGVPIRGK